MARQFAIASVVICLSTSLICAADHDPAVQRAIKDGQQYLRAVQKAGANGGLPGVAIVGVGGNGRGGDSLTGLALIESGVPANDPLVVDLARAARQSALGSNATYELSLAIMFLDRFGAKEDRGLIQFLTLKLMSGQSRDGSWSYTCSGVALNPVQERLILQELAKDARLATPDSPRPPKKETKPREDNLDGPKTPKKDQPEPAKETPREDTKPRLHPALEDYAKAVRGVAGQLAHFAGGDHSNTQFATVGLWCGRRHGVDVSAALNLLDKHYRACQNGDGGWSYTATGSSSPAMTCAGLMGLAMGFGAKNLDSRAGGRADPDAIAQDKSVEAGLKYVGDFIAAAGAERRAPGGPGFGDFQPNGLSANLYFMWSLERVGMVYGLTTIGKVDWYDWGSKVLVASQQRDGSWQSGDFHSGSPENATALALLFLSKANLAEDLSTSLKGKVKDPGTSRLRSPGDLNKLLEGAGKGSTGPKDSGTATTRPKSDPATIGDADKGGKLAAALVGAADAERADLLKQYRESKGGEFTDALARAAGKLSGEAQTQTRDALAQRLTRMTTITLNDLMRDRDRELRRAAALAAGSKGKDRLSEFAPALIRLVADDEAMVAQAARASLKTLSGQDFGPEAGAGPADRGKALIAWRSWWEKQKQ